jgi:hypothetical protein
MALKQHNALSGSDLHVNKLHADTHVAGGTDPLEFTHWAGEYNPATSYVVEDLVTYQNVLYICILACSGVLPTVVANWTSVASGPWANIDGGIWTA